ncbi:recombinase RecT, partial [Escherichia coli]|uniref:recombinase RecT n=1 Tax=Escherichia coli TaxID=562 RepID=UPI001F1784C1
TGNQEAQFQMGWKGYLQLAQRSGQIKKIASIAVYDTDTEESVKARLTSFIPQKVSGEVIGYLAYLETVTGFEAHLTMTNEELEQHASKYSQTYKTAKSKGQSYSVWHQNWDAMCQKTVIKLLISKYAPMSVELQQAIEFDQAVINLDGEASYVDNDQESEKPLARLISEDQFPQFGAAIEAGS